MPCFHTTTIGSQKVKKRGKILFRGDGPSSAESVELKDRQLLEIVTVKIPIGTSCETMKKLCVEDHGGHCTDEGEKCCEIDACVVCFEGWTGPNCNIRKGYREMTSLLLIFCL